MSLPSSTHGRERTLFDTVAALVQSSSVPSSTISDATKLSFYGLYKRVSVGPLNTINNPLIPIEKERPKRPSRFNLVAWYKYEAWEKCDGLSDSEAMMAYVQLAADQDNQTGRECKRLLEEYKQEITMSPISDQLQENRMNESLRRTTTLAPTTAATIDALTASLTQTPTVVQSASKKSIVKLKRSTSFWKPLLPRGQIDIQYLDLFYAFKNCIFFITLEFLSRFLFLLRSPCSIPSWIRYHDSVIMAWKESYVSNLKIKKSRDFGDTEQDVVVGLSVRSLLDLYLSVRQYPPGSEIIITPPFNIEGMIRVLQYHKLNVVPVDIHLDTGDKIELDFKDETTTRLLPFKVDLSKIQKCISTKTVAIMIVHPFGTLSCHDEEMKQLHEFIFAHNQSISRPIDILEDCAQCYSSMIYRGSPLTHAQFFSFGTIKTSTALGGGIVVIRQNLELVTKMKEWQCRMYGQQTHLEYMIKVIKMTVLRYISSHPFVSGIILQFIQRLGLDYDQVVTEMVRGFQVSSPSDQGKLNTSSHHLMKQLRRRPCLALLSLLRRRFYQWKQTQIIVVRRVARCRDINQRLLKSSANIRIPVAPTDDNIRQLYWLHPILVKDPMKIERALRVRGFDVPRGTSQMKCITQYLVGSPAEQSCCPNAELMMQHVLYLPSASINIQENAISELCIALEEATHSQIDEEDSEEGDSEKGKVYILRYSMFVAFLALRGNLRTFFTLFLILFVLFVYSFWFLLFVFISLRVLVGDYYIDKSDAYSKYMCMDSESKENTSDYSNVDSLEDKWTIGPFDTHKQSSTILSIEALRLKSPTPRIMHEENIQVRFRVLLTGATGFIGSLLLRDLLLRRKVLNIDGGVIVICRSRKTSTAAERVHKLLDDPMFSFLSAEDKQNLVLVLEGDVTLPNLGLSEIDYHKLTNSLQISHIIHCAASVSFTQSLPEAASSNITSSLMMQSLRKAMKNKMTKFIYVSTAFVQGRETGTVDKPLTEILYCLDPFDPFLIYESMLTTQVYAQEAMIKFGFPNTYTLSKCVCEHLLAQDDTGGPTIIFRPSIVGPSIHEPHEGWSGFYPSTLIASGCLFYKFQYLLWSFSNEMVPVIPVDIVVKYIIARAFSETDDDLFRSPRSQTANADLEEFHGFEILSSSKSKSKIGVHLININSTVIHNVAWDSSTRRQSLFSWYDYALAILQNGCMKGILTRPVAYLAILIVVKGLPVLNLSHGLYMLLHRGVVNISIAFMKVFSWKRGYFSLEKEKLCQLRQYLDLPILFVPYTQHTFYFQSELTTTDDFNGERYMFSCVLAAEKFVGSYRRTKSRDVLTMKVQEVTIPKKVQLLTDILWASTQPRGSVIIRFVAFFMRQLFFLSGVHLTIDPNSFSEISQAIDELRCQTGETYSIVLAPTHRSLYDFLLISYVIFSIPEVQIDLPYIAAAEDFATLPVLGSLAHYCGAFFIKRGRGQADKQLGQQIFQLNRFKQRKHPMCYEIFIEGKRSRDRVFIKPKTGLLKCLQAVDKNLIIVPMTINYETVPDQWGLIEEAKGRSNKHFNMSNLLHWLKSVIKGKVKIGDIHIAASRPLVIKESSTDWTMVVDIIQQRQMQNCYMSNYHIKCGAEALKLNPDVLRQGLISAGCRLWPEIKYHALDKPLGTLVDLDEAWYGFLHTSHLLCHFVHSKNFHWLNWLRGLRCPLLSNDPCFKAVSDRMNEIFADVDSAIGTTEIYLGQKGYNVTTPDHILQYAWESHPNLPLLLLNKALTMKQTFKHLSIELRSSPNYEQVLEDRLHTNHHRRLPGSDGENFGAWGYHDTAFTIRSNTNGHIVVTLTGERYTVSGRNFPSLISFMEEEMGVKINPRIQSIPIAPIRPKVSPSMLSMEQLKKVKFVLNEQEERVSRDPVVRARHGTGHSQEDMFLIRQDRLFTARVPDAVVYPKNEEEVYELLKIAVAENLKVIPFGGGTNVTHAIRCPSIEHEPRPILSIDMRLMNCILSIHDEDGVAHVQAGITGKALLSELASRGFTMGHEPDSYEFSTLGGWIATNASGMKQNKYGNIEQIVKDVRVVSSKGVVWQSAGPNAVCSGRSSIGTNLVSLMIGSEGSLGIITSAKIKIWPLPPKKMFDSFLFHSYENGIRFVREISKMGALKPASVRLLDNKQFRLGYSMIDSSSTTQRLISTMKSLFRQFFLSSYMTRSTVCCTLCYEGMGEDIEIQRKLVNRISSKHDGFPSGGTVGESGYNLTFAIAYLRDFAMTYGFLAESFETFAPWSKVDEIIRRTDDRIHQEHKKRALIGRPFISSRITQLYDEGACIYFYLCLYLDGVSEPHIVFSDIESAARETILLHGGTLSHHHGVGNLRSPFMKYINSDTFRNVLNNVKEAFDPDNVFVGSGSYSPKLEYFQHEH